MEKSVFRKLSIYLAFIQMFSGGIKAFADAPMPESISNEDPIEEIYPTANERDVVLVDENIKNNPIYRRVDPDSGELENISIFDEENIPSKQYGADQSVFTTYFYKLLIDPYIWPEVSNDFPVSDYGSKDEALLRYEELFKILSECGCGFAAGADYIFRMFEGKEDLFYKKFGFPMYTVIDNDVDFNYEPLMFKFFIYKTKKQYGSLEPLKKLIEKRVAMGKLAEAERQSKLMKHSFNEMKHWDKKTWDDYKEIYSKIKADIKEYKAQSEVELDEADHFGIMIDKDFGYFRQFLAQYGIHITIKIADGLKHSKVDNILARHVFDLSYVDVNGNVFDDIEDVNNHYVYVTGMTEDGQYIVSSWGYKCYMGEESIWTKRLILSNKK